eukprot:TRINITY_DN12878_c0_g1_i6.p1 TRINITY_DN12878_c0_g1~~TRINITY_DN12878_c0_g1_i6.p1  ORF type:complete len:122 (+),score=44.39 TRINITY_DN12878_c0_g1_i6:56-421(+)
MIFYCFSHLFLFMYLFYIVIQFLLLFFFFFFKQKTAYEMLRSLVGSEMCIRDRENAEIKELATAWGVSSREMSSAVGLEEDKERQVGHEFLALDSLLGLLPAMFEFLDRVALTQTNAAPGE